MQLAIFDLDNTLLNGDSDYQWGQFLIEIGVLNGAEHTARNEQFYADYKEGKLDIYAFLAFQLKPLSQYPRAQLDAWHAQYMRQKIMPMMTESSRNLVEKHRANGDLLLIITATNSFVTAPIAKAFGIDHLIGTTPEEINGEFTGGVSGTPSFQQGKITRLNEWLSTRGQTLNDFETTWFYSDSHNDLPLMQMVDKPVAVNADPTLKAYAEAHGWPMMSLRE
ncbi:MAG TPA: HAD family hydrolase [Methylophilaceae bacterium]